MAKHAAKPVSAISPSRPNAVVTLRESSIITMAKVGALHAAQVDAAFRLRNLWLEFERLYPRDNPFERVDEGVEAGGGRELVRIDAYNKLMACRRIVGRHGFRLIVQVCCQGYGLTELFATRRERDTAADVLRIHLDELAAEWRNRG